MPERSPVASAMLARARTALPPQPFAQPGRQDMVKLTVLVPKDLHKALRRAALDEGVSVAALVRAWTAEWLSARQGG